MSEADRPDEKTASQPSNQGAQAPAPKPTTENEDEAALQERAKANAARTKNEDG